MLYSRLSFVFAFVALEFVSARSALSGVKETLEDFRALEIAIDSPQDLDSNNGNSQIMGVTVTQTYFLQRVSLSDRNESRTPITDQYFNSQTFEIESVTKMDQSNDILDPEPYQYNLDPEAKRTLAEYFKTMEQNLEKPSKKIAQRCR
ncbi:hypothetical protein Ddc_12021 [Ditylenchus destructor]|nr:hypothetical protein Ddc_12021 [Ditylenchus destructor]